jgi:hypothetical protein
MLDLPSNHFNSASKVSKLGTICGCYYKPSPKIAPAPVKDRNADPSLDRNVYPLLDRSANTFNRNADPSLDRKANSSFEQDADPSLDRNVEPLLEEAVQPKKEAAPEEVKSQKSPLFLQILLAFDFRQNFQGFVRIKRPSGGFGALDGLRVISMVRKLFNST